jgi:serine/threonine protein kinase
MRFFKRKKPPVTALDSAFYSRDLLQLADARTAICRQCSHRIPATAYEPLTTIACPKCSSPVFVPAKMCSFSLYKFIGRGGMGMVYKAVSADYPGEYFAVKILPPGLKDHEICVGALINEAEMAQAFHGHPNIVEAVEFGESEDGEYFLVTGFVEGDRLDTRIQNKGPMTQKEVIEMGLALVKVEQFICKKGYLYRDMKPENIMLRRGVTPIVLDFGLCRTLRQAEYERLDEEVEGAPHFMPPERMAGEPEKIYSEIYSVGMVMYYALTGNTFFAHGPIQEVAEKYVLSDRSQSKLPSMSSVNKDLADVIHRMIQTRPPDRQQSLERLERDLQNCRRGL